MRGKAVFTSKANTVVAALSADEAHSVPLAIGTMVLQCNLQGGVHSRGAAHREEDVVEVSAGQKLKDLLRELVGQLVGSAEGGGIVHLLHLVLDGIDDLSLSVACVHAPQTRHAIKDGGSVFQEVVDTLGSVEDTRVLPEVDVVGEGHPEIVIGDSSTERAQRRHLRALGNTPEIRSGP